MFARSERALIEHIAFQQGFDLAGAGEAKDVVLRSSTAPGSSVIVSGLGGGRFQVSVHLPIVNREIRREFADLLVDDALVAEEAQLYAVLGRAYHLSVALPNAPLQRFHQAVESIHLIEGGTEREQLVIQRVGQDIFRKALEDYWAGRCAVTAVGDRELLRASHIKPWADCSDAERLDVFNGILLTAHLDAAFDKALMTIDPDGVVRFSTRLSQEALRILNPAGARLSIPISPSHEPYLAVHRERFWRVQTQSETP